jgi:hypothetical protein
VGVLDRRWSRIVPDLYRLQSGLERLDVKYANGEVSYGKIEEVHNV